MRSLLKRLLLLFQAYRYISNYRTEIKNSSNKHLINSFKILQRNGYAFSAETTTLHFLNLISELNRKRQFIKKFKSQSIECNSVVKMTFSAEKKSHRRRYLIIGLAVFVLVIVIVAAVVASGIINNKTGNLSESVGPKTVPLARGGVLDVKVSDYDYYVFPVPKGASNPVVNGSFSVTSGSGNEINVYLMDEPNWLQWWTGHSDFTMLYNSGQVSTGVLDVDLPSNGTYYLVFDNQFSTSAKTISTNISLEYVS